MSGFFDDLFDMVQKMIEDMDKASRGDSMAKKAIEELEKLNDYYVHAPLLCFPQRNHVYEKAIRKRTLSTVKLLIY